MSSSACWRRVRALEESGVITGYSALVDRERAGFLTSAILHVSLERHDATFVTQSLSSDLTPLARSGSIAWRGSDASAGHDATAFAIPGVGTVRVSCSGALLGARSVSIDAAQGGSVTTREGSEDTSRPQELGPVSADLPNNGMLFVTLADGTRLVVSSRWKVNDPDPTQNSCFVAAQAITGA